VTCASQIERVGPEPTERAVLLPGPGIDAASLVGFDVRNALEPIGARGHATGFVVRRARPFVEALLACATARRFHRAARVGALAAPGDADIEVLVALRDGFRDPTGVRVRHDTRSVFREARTRRMRVG